jgi:hypothetical protein
MTEVANVALRLLEPGFVQRQQQTLREVRDCAGAGNGDLGTAANALKLRRFDEYIDRHPLLLGLADCRTGRGCRLDE